MMIFFYKKFKYIDFFNEYKKKENVDINLIH